MCEAHDWKTQLWSVIPLSSKVSTKEVWFVTDINGQISKATLTNTKIIDALL